LNGLVNGLVEGYRVRQAVAVQHPNDTRMNLSEHINLFPYPKDARTRIAFIIADLISATIILGIAFIALKSTMHF
jgi:hypothetical protein